MTEPASGAAGGPGSPGLTAAPRSRVRALVVVGTAAALVLAFALTLRLQPGGAFASRAVDDIGQCVAALAGGLCIVWRAGGLTGRARTARLMLGGALLCWAAGEAIWSFYEIGLRRPTPFPSFADLGFLLFPVLALAALLARPSSGLAGHGRIRIALDGTMVGCSILAASWATTLGAVYRGGAESTLGYVVGLAYPVSDIVLLTVAAILLVHGVKERQMLVLLAGIALMAFADSGFAYLTAIGSYQTGSIVDVAWFAAFLIMGLSSLVPATARPVVVTDERRIEAPFLLAVPYLAVLASTVFVFGEILRGTIDPVLLMVQGAGMLALATRQFLTVLDNRTLARDVLAREAELHFRAFHDNLTGLANRALLHDRVAHALTLTRRDGRKVQLMFCDLDDFKTVNDSLGHDAGDELLVEVARRLRGCTRDGDTVARLGGDEFAILLEGDADVDAVAQRVLTALEEPIEVFGRSITVAASLGTASVEPGDDISNHELLQRADRAMYAAKAAGKGGTVSFTPTLGRHASADLDERVRFGHDIRNRALGTTIVPIVDEHGTPIAAEALAHWSYDGRDVGHERVLKLARRMGFASEVALHTTQAALAGARHRELPVAVHLGGYAPDTDRMLDRLGTLLAETGLPADHLIVQLPECRPGEETQPLLLLARLREAGIRVALDDFGIGYSNLALLGELKPDFVKLDRSLIAPLCGSRTAQLLARGVVALAHDLGAAVIAEAVETAEQRDLLLTIGCDAFQGRLYGEPEMVAPARTLAAA